MLCRNVLFSATRRSSLKLRLIKRFKYHFKDMFIKSSLISLFLLMYGLFNPDAAVCQSTLNLTDEQKAHIANKLHIGLDSKYMRRLLNRQTANTHSDNDYPKKIIMHIRGKSKFKFPPSEKFYQNLKELGEQQKIDKSTFSPTEDDLRLQRKEELFAVASTLDTSLPTCQRGVTEKHDDLIRGESNNDEPTYDFLILKKDTKYPENTQEAFGKNTVVRYYSTVGFFSKVLADLNIHCLPFRIRSMGNTFIKDEGRNALLNYDKDFYGSGELKTSVARTMRIR